MMFPLTHVVLFGNIFVANIALAGGVVIDALKCVGQCPWTVTQKMIDDCIWIKNKNLLITGTYYTSSNQEHIIDQCDMYMDPRLIPKTVIKTLRAS